MKTFLIFPPNLRRPRASVLRRDGFTLIEMMMVITILAMVAVLVMPMLTDNTRLRLQAGASIVISDLELAQVMTMAQPDRPVLVRFDNANSRYWLAYADNPGDPITHPQSGEPYLVSFGSGRASSVGDILLNARLGTGGTDLRFAPHGGLEQFGLAPNINLGIPQGDRTYWIIVEIDTSTGSMSQSYLTTGG